MEGGRGGGKDLVNASVVQKPQSRRKFFFKLPDLQVGASATTPCLCQCGDCQAARCTHTRRAGANTQLEGRGSPVRFVLLEKCNTRPEWLSMARRGPCCLQPHPKEIGADGRAPRPHTPSRTSSMMSPLILWTSAPEGSALDYPRISKSSKATICTSRKGLRLRVGQTYRWRGSLGYTLSLQGSLLLPGGRASARVASRGRTHSSPVRAEPEGRRRFTAGSAPGL